MGTNSNAGLSAETLVTPLCNSMHAAARLVRSKHIPVMPKQALLTAAHFSCVLKFNSVPTNPRSCPSPPAHIYTHTTPPPGPPPPPPPRGEKDSLLTSVISNKLHLILYLLWSRRSLLCANGGATPTARQRKLFSRPSVTSSKINHVCNDVLLKFTANGCRSQTETANGLFPSRTNLQFDGLI